MKVHYSVSNNRIVIVLVTLYKYGIRSDGIGPNVIIPATMTVSIRGLVRWDVPFKSLLRLPPFIWFV